MRITDSRKIYEAFVNNSGLNFDPEGNIEASKSYGLMSLFSRATVPPPQLDDRMLLGLAGIIDKENLNKQGPQTLTQNLYLEGNTSEETLTKAKLILAESMIQHHVDTCLKDKPDHIKNGANIYLQSLWVKAKRDPSFPDIKAFVEQHLSYLEAKDVLDVLACGFTLETKDLTSQKNYLEEGLKQAVKSTWCQEKQQDFDSRGIYNIFVLDAGRERPCIFGHKLSRDDFNNQNAGERYGNLLAQGLGKDSSMVALTSILLSQTSMVTQAEMISGLNTDFPLNPYQSISDLNVKDFITLVATDDPNIHRSTLTQTDTEIKIDQHIRVAIKNINNAHAATVGSLDLSLIIPKNQFPLPLGAEPTITISEIVFDKQKGYTE